MRIKYAPSEKFLKSKDYINRFSKLYKFISGNEYYCELTEEFYYDLYDEKGRKAMIGQSFFNANLIDIEKVRDDKLNILLN